MTTREEAMNYIEGQEVYDTKNEREEFLLNVIAYLDEMDPWYLSQAPQWVMKLEKEYGYQRSLKDLYD